MRGKEKMKLENLESFISDKNISGYKKIPVYEENLRKLLEVAKAAKEAHLEVLEYQRNNGNLSILIMHPHLVLGERIKKLEKED